MWISCLVPPLVEVSSESHISLKPSLKSQVTVACKDKGIRQWRPHDGQWRPQTVTMTASVTEQPIAVCHCLAFSCHCLPCGRHFHGLWPSFYWLKDKVVQLSVVSWCDNVAVITQKHLWCICDDTDVLKITYILSFHSSGFFRKQWAITYR